MLYALVFKQLSGENPGKKACWKSATLIMGGTKTAMQTQITTNVPCSRFFPLGYGLFGCMLLLYPRALPDELCTSTGLCYWNAAKSPAHILRFQFRGRPAEDIWGWGEVALISVSYVCRMKGPCQRLLSLSRGTC